MASRACFLDLTLELSGTLKSPQKAIPMVHRWYKAFLSGSLPSPSLSRTENQGIPEAAKWGICGASQPAEWRNWTRLLAAPTL